MKPQKTLQWAIQQNNESLFVTLSGELTRDTLLPLWKQRASFLSPKGNQPIYWDLKALERLDSAGFALFAELLNQYQKQTPNKVMNAPDVLKSLAALFGLTAWLTPFLV